MEIMNRKQYIRPEMESVRIESEEMIQVSPKLPSSPGTPSIKNAQMREMPDDIDVSEEENLW